MPLIQLSVEWHQRNRVFLRRMFWANVGKTFIEKYAVIGRGVGDRSNRTQLIYAMSAHGVLSISCRSMWLDRTSYHSDCRDKLLGRVGNVEKWRMINDKRFKIINDERNVADFVVSALSNDGPYVTVQWHISIYISFRGSCTWLVLCCG